MDQLDGRCAAQTLEQTRRGLGVDAARSSVRRNQYCTVSGLLEAAEEDHVTTTTTQSTTLCAKGVLRFYSPEKVVPWIILEDNFLILTFC
jgi:uncharacterized membrane protein (UPF0136 family)